MKQQGTVPIETERLLLRRFVLSDSEAMFRNWAGHPVVTKFLTWDAHESEKESRQLLSRWCKQYRKRNFYEWAIELKELGEPIGSIGAVQTAGWKTFEVGYCIGERWWGQELAVEALQAVIRFLFQEVRCHKIEAKYAEGNVASMRVMQKAGMCPKSGKEVFVSTDKGFFTCPIYEIKNQLT